MQQEVSQTIISSLISVGVTSVTRHLPLQKPSEFATTASPELSLI